MDAITQLIESYFRVAPSRFRRPWPKADCDSPCGRSKRPSQTAPTGKRGRGWPTPPSCPAIALANSGLGLAHGVAAALGIHCRVAHGLACAVMLPAALRMNRDVRRSEMARLWSLVDSQPAGGRKAGRRPLHRAHRRADSPHRHSRRGCRRSASVARPNPGTRQRLARQQHGRQSPRRQRRGAADLLEAML